MTDSLTDLAFDEQGLIPGVVQDATTGKVLMLGWLNRAAVDATLSTGEVHFWSRSRQELWRKGETSGNVLSLQGVSVDCDRDTLLIRAVPAGPTCHTGTVSCFDDESYEGFAWLEDLWSTIDQRATERPDGSYTTTLIDAGPDLTARKVLEEATEVLIAAKNHAAGIDNDQRLAEEVADLLYHTLVVLRERDVAPTLVIEELRKRHSSS